MSPQSQPGIWEASLLKLALVPISHLWIVLNATLSSIRAGSHGCSQFWKKYSPYSSPRATESPDTDIPAQNDLSMTLLPVMFEFCTHYEQPCKSVHLHPSYI